LSACRCEILALRFTSVSTTSNVASELKSCSSASAVTNELPKHVLLRDLFIRDRMRSLYFNKTFTVHVPAVALVHAYVCCVLGDFGRFASQILSGMVFIRNHGIIHCDLKPENIMLRSKDKSKYVLFLQQCLYNVVKLVSVVGGATVACSTHAVALPTRILADSTIQNEMHGESLA